MGIHIPQMSRAKLKVEDEVFARAAGTGAAAAPNIFSMLVASPRVKSQIGLRPPLRLIPIFPIFLAQNRTPLENNSAQLVASFAKAGYQSFWHGIHPFNDRMKNKADYLL